MVQFVVPTNFDIVFGKKKNIFAGILCDFNIIFQAKQKINIETDLDYQIVYVGEEKSDFAHTSLNCSYGLKAGYKMFSTRKFDFNFFVAFKEDLPFAAVPNSRHPFYDYKGSLQYNVLSLNFQILMQ